MKNRAKKILVLGVDGMDPRLTAKYVAEGKMPNIKTFIDRGAQREDLVMLGGMPTITPPMWTTLATGAYPNTHGITDFYRQSKEDLDVIEYNLDSNFCKAEQIWNVFAENGKKTLVWHWPGSSWPPTSDSPNLHVVDGSSPGNVNMSVAQIESEYILNANVKTKEVTFQEKGASGANAMCIITDLQVNEKKGINLTERLRSKKQHNIFLSAKDGQGNIGFSPLDIAVSPIKEPAGWVNAPADAKEFTLLYSGGLIRRPSLILKNEQGIYDKVAIYKSKKEPEPIAVCKNNEFVKDVIDEAIRDDKRFTVNRNMLILELAEDGTLLKMWISAAMDLNNDTLFYPKELHRKIIDNVGYPQPTSMLGSTNAKLIKECVSVNWSAAGEWQAKTLNYLIDNEGYDVVISHFHNIDLQGHYLMRHMEKGNEYLAAEAYREFVEDMYKQTDDYLGAFTHYLDEGWTIFVVSDHGLVCTANRPPMLGDSNGVNVRLMEELGFTAIKKDENGNDLKEIDWTKTKAIATRGNFITLNIKGRDKYGIVDPQDQYMLEEEIITALYGYKHPETGHRVVSLAVRNKDAVLFGLGGPECGDIIYFLAEGYNYDHGDCLSTTLGRCDTSVSPIFVAAGPGIKENYKTKRVIREVDFAPTLAAVAGIRVPRECEGAPVYQILAEE